MKIESMHLKLPDSWLVMRFEFWKRLIYSKILWIHQSPFCIIINFLKAVIGSHNYKRILIETNCPNLAICHKVVGNFFFIKNNFKSLQKLQTKCLEFALVVLIQLHEQHNFSQWFKNFAGRHLHEILQDSFSFLVTKNKVRQGFRSQRTIIQWTCFILEN